MGQNTIATEGERKHRYFGWNTKKGNISFCFPTFQWIIEEILKTKYHARMEAHSKGKKQRSNYDELLIHSSWFPFSMIFGHMIIQKEQ